MSGSLFRQEVVDARRGEWLGSIIIAAPLSRWLLVMLALALVVAIALLLCLGHYTLRETVTGQVVPSAGLLHVYAPSAGTLASLHVRDGQVVRKGDLLLELSSAADSAALGDTHALVGQQLAAQRAGLQADLRNQQQLSQQQADGLRGTMALLRGQLAQITGQLDIAQQQITSNQQLLTRIQPLGAKGFVSALQISSSKLPCLMRRRNTRPLCDSNWMPASSWIAPGASSRNCRWTPSPSAMTSSAN